MTADPDWTLTRWSLRADVTFGTLRGPAGFRSETMECPWLGNAPFISCIPEGDYVLERHVLRPSSTNLPTYALVGGTVSHWRNPAKPRYAVCLHRASRPWHLQGCIAPVSSVTSSEKVWATPGDSFDHWMRLAAEGQRFRIQRWGAVEFPAPAPPTLAA